MDKRNIVWLASYPKSGNTWFRAFITALIGETEDIDLNGLKTSGIFSSREIFNAFTDLDSTYLYDEEVKQVIPEVFTAFSEEVEKLQYIKIHDAYILNSNNIPIVPTQGSKCIVYIIRNPLDVVASFANHMASSIDHAIDLMNKEKGALAVQKRNLNLSIQFKQVMLSWNAHVLSWTQQTQIPVKVIKYEDMLQHASITFAGAVDFMGMDNISQEKINLAIEATSFNKLQQKEKTTGFIEKSASSPAFFRSGIAGNWMNELTRDQAQRIVDNHGEVMKQYGYPVNLNEYYK